MPSLKVPSEAEMSRLPGTKIIDRAPPDGFWSYEITDPGGLRLRLSYNILDRSVQARVLVADAEVCTVSQEGGVAIQILSDEGRPFLRCHFKTRTTHGTLEIQLVPRIRIHSGTLVDED